MECVVDIFHRDSDLRDDAVDQSRWCDIEGWIPDINAFCCYSDRLDYLGIEIDPVESRPGIHCDFYTLPLLDDDTLAGESTRVDCRARCSDQELNAMIPSKNSLK